MDRREFCRIAALSIGAIGLGRLECLASTSRNPTVGLPLMPADCRVDVLRRECFIDLQAEFLDDPESGACPRFKVGEKFSFAKGDSCPDGFCPALWDAAVGAVARARSCQHDTPLSPNQLIVACPDGTRPVIVSLMTPSLISSMDQ